MLRMEYEAMEKNRELNKELCELTAEEKELKSKMETIVHLALSPTGQSGLIEEVRVDSLGWLFAHLDDSDCRKTVNLLLFIIFKYRMLRKTHNPLLTKVLHLYCCWVKVQDTGLHNCKRYSYCRSKLDDGCRNCKGTVTHFICVILTLTLHLFKGPNANGKTNITINQIVT